MRLLSSRCGTVRHRIRCGSTSRPSLESSNAEFTRRPRRGRTRPRAESEDRNDYIVEEATFYGEGRQPARARGGLDVRGCDRRPRRCWSARPSGARTSARSSAAGAPPRRRRQRWLRLPERTARPGRRNPPPDRPSMPFWRRQEPFHERLAREAGLGPEHAARSGAALGRSWHPRDPPAATVGCGRNRRCTGRARRAGAVRHPPRLSLLIEDYEHDDDSPLADAAEDAVELLCGWRPCARAARCSASARRIRVEEASRTLRSTTSSSRSGGRASASCSAMESVSCRLPSIERLIERRGENVIRARRLDGSSWRSSSRPCGVLAGRLAGGRGCRSRRTE